jgi:hypothetical protein
MGVMTNDLESAPPRKTGRPSSYAPEIGLAICQALAEGMSLRQVCQAPDAPDKSTLAVVYFLFAAASDKTPSEASAP